MKKHKKTALAMSAALLTLALMGTACSSNNNNANTSPSASPSSSASPSASITPDSANETPDASPELISATGKYVGLQDSHAIEIETEQGSEGFQVSAEIADKVDSWEENTPVKFEYKVETIDANGSQIEQKTIITIDKE
ncbi:hypothetical protein [Cohnella terricola]|uniref:Uncharacterized protein n=1 Tax=Cohnella terricola TaxID=1289167 RepID=A0A559JEE0_9BACL|nr:hypothetical protein [Cohnella terricola]TVX98227.1 hypothetical protein FPZ45_16130 [Cohnella terricola]